jgi:SlyX protein
MEDRLTDLEYRYMLQERTIQELSDTVYRQELIIEQLQRDLQQIAEQLKMALPSLTAMPDDDEPPPHY